MMMHRSISEVVRDTGTWASALTVMSLDFAREILLFRMTSVILLPVFSAVSTSSRSALSSFRYAFRDSRSPAWA